jgi:ubiquinone/menaquinone biosynthesis C-methylase UbiE
VAGSAAPGNADQTPGAAPPRTGSDGPVYVLGSDQIERDRLQRQSDEFTAHSTELIDRAGMAPGWRVIDLGCGPSGAIELLSHRVGPTGRVTGVEQNPDSVAMARELASERGLGNVEITQADARSTGLPGAAFDLVHARTLLVNLPDAAHVVAEMARLTRPGGWVVAMEPDCDMYVCHPPHPALDRLREIFLAAYLTEGADPFVGRRLAELFRQAGLADVGVAAKADVYPLGHSRRAIRADLVRSMRSKLVDRGIAGEQELDDVDKAVRAHLADPDTLIMPALYFLAWARKPIC